MQQDASWVADGKELIQKPPGDRDHKKQQKVTNKATSTKKDHAWQDLWGWPRENQQRLINPEWISIFVVITHSISTGFNTFAANYVGIFGSDFFWRMVF